MSADDYFCPQCQTTVSKPLTEHPCPKCGTTRRHVFSADGGKGTDRTISRRMTYWEKNWPWFIPTIALTFISPFLGLGFTGWTGVVVGLALNVVGLVLGFLAVTRTVETDFYNL